MAGSIGRHVVADLRFGRHKNPPAGGFLLLDATEYSRFHLKSMVSNSTAAKAASL